MLLSKYRHLAGKGKILTQSSLSLGSGFRLQVDEKDKSLTPANLGAGGRLPAGSWFVSSSLLESREQVRNLRQQSSGAPGGGFPCPNALSVGEGVNLRIRALFIVFKIGRRQGYFLACFLLKKWYGLR